MNVMFSQMLTIREMWNPYGITEGVVYIQLKTFLLRVRIMLSDLLEGDLQDEPVGK